MREKRSQYHGKKSKSNKGCLIVLGIILLLVLIGGIFVAKFISDINQTVENVQVQRDPQQINLRQEEDGSQTNPDTNPSQLIEEKQPFSLLLLGIDNDENSGIKGRSDIIIVGTLNPDSHKLTLTSIPRDTLTEIVGRNEQDKINHAYAFGGIAMSANTVQELLDIPIDYTLAINMEGFVDIVDIFGGVTITARETFSQGAYQFVEGQTYQMDGDMVLAYIRNRKDAGGDYGRQVRARQVIEAALRQAASLDSIFNVSGILNTLEGNVLTDLPIDNLLSFVQDYQQVIQSVDTLQLQGTSQIIDGIYYEIIDEQSLNEVSQQLQNELEIES